MTRYSNYETREQDRDEKWKRAKERGLSLPWELPTERTDPRDNPFGGEAKHHGGA